MAEQAAALAQLREQWPQLEYVEAWVSDVNGIARGKRLPASELERLYAAGLNLPASTLLLDVWGNEVPATGLVFDSGDADYPCHPVGGPLPAPWSQGRGAQVLLGLQLVAGLVLLTAWALGAGWVGPPADGTLFRGGFHVLYGGVFPVVVLVVGHRVAWRGRLNPHTAFAQFAIDPFLDGDRRLAPGQ